MAPSEGDNWYHVGQCPICDEHGYVVYMKRISSDTLYLRCYECGQTFASYKDYVANTPSVSESHPLEFGTRPTAEELEKQGSWHFVKGECLYAGPYTDGDGIVVVPRGYTNLLESLKREGIPFRVIS